ncbi:MAG: adenosylhomocysteinase [Nitrososphaerales archaeon]
MVSKVANLALAELGEKNYNWAYNHMPALVKTIEKADKGKPLQGLRLAACLHVTKETSVLVMGLKRLGAEVYLAGANPLSTQDDIAAFLANQEISVYAWRGENEEEYFDCIRTILRANPHIMLDDGADAHVTLHQEDEFKALKPLGGTEETTTGIIRLKALEASGNLRYPIIGVNNAYSKYLFDNRYGTGQSTLDGLLRATSLLMAGKRLVICGYGWVGRGIALRARGLGCKVIVTEVNPLRALEAHLDGFDVMPLNEAAKLGDMFVTATGQYRVIRGEHIENMKDGAILANAGHFDVEIDVNYLEENKESIREVRNYVEEYKLKSGKRIYLVSKGRVVNLVAAEGHPPEVMMMSFSNQLLSVIYIAKNFKELKPNLMDVPKEIDEQVARNALEGFNVKIDELTEEQIAYSKSYK